MPFLPRLPPPLLPAAVFTGDCFRGFSCYNTRVSCNFMMRSAAMQNNAKVGGILSIVAGGFGILECIVLIIVAVLVLVLGRNADMNSFDNGGEIALTILFVVLLSHGYHRRTAWRHGDSGWRLCLEEEALGAGSGRLDYGNDGILALRHPGDYFYCLGQEGVSYPGAVRGNRAPGRSGITNRREGRYGFAQGGGGAEVSWRSRGTWHFSPFTSPGGR